MGTRCGHWGERCLREELLTGFLNASAAVSPLSRITIASLDDIGYTVDYSTAEPYGAENLAPWCICNQTQNPSMRGMHQIDSSPIHRKLRRLSNEARQTAVNYGLSVLSQQSKSYAISQSRAFNEDGGENDDGLVFVGDQVVSVFMQDVDGSVFDVVVRKDSNR